MVEEVYRLVKECKLNIRDATHSVCAIQNGIKEIVSDDPDLDSLKEAKRIRLEEI